MISAVVAGCSSPVWSHKYLKIYNALFLLTIIFIETLCKNLFPCFLDFSFSYGLHPKYKINNVADPDDGEDHAGYDYAGPHHHEEADSHHQRHRDDDAQLGLYRHPFFLHKGFQVLFVKFRTDKPVVELLGGVGKAEHRRQKKRHGRQDRQRHSYAPKPQAEEAQNQKYQPFQFHGI